MKKIHIAHSPDSDDAFMFYGLATHKVDGEGLEFEHILQDIETLNRRALEGTYEISAVSIHAYAYLADKYALLGSGASMGEQYGPMVIAKEKFSLSELKSKKIAVPGTLTSAFLILELLLNAKGVPSPLEREGGRRPGEGESFEYVVVPFDQIIDEVKKGTVDAGLIIHEGQLQYEEMGLHLIVDLGKWWFEKYQLPLPLGGNAVRRDLGTEMMKKLARIQKASIAYGLNHRKDALEHAMQYARDLTTENADKFVGMYVNERTLDYGEDGKKAVRLLLDLAHEKKLIPHKVNVEFID